MQVLNYFDELYTIHIAVTETPKSMWVVVDTGLGNTVLETTSCALCDTGKISTATTGGLTLDATSSVSGNLPTSTYSGKSGTVTMCIYK